MPRTLSAEPKYPLLLWLPPDVRKVLVEEKQRSRVSLTKIIIQAVRKALDCPEENL